MKQWLWAASIGAVSLLALSARASLIHQFRKTGAYRLPLTVGMKDASQPLFSAQTEGIVPEYQASDYGYALVGVPGCDIWWCESTYKISPARPAARLQSDGIRLSAAGSERVHAQLVLRPDTETGPIQISASDLRGPNGSRIPKSALQVRYVAYVRVRVPTDRIGLAAEWPDPLPPLEGAWKPKPGRNNPLWITITVPPEVRPGDYTGSILLQAPRWKRVVPLRLHVWGFSLPERTALRSGFGINPDNIRRYHNLRSDASMQKVWDLYMRDFAAHRLGVYNPMALSGIKVEEKTGPHVAMDFAEFDRAAHRYLDVMGFNSFTMGVLGMGTGRFPNYDQGSFLGHPAGTPEYDALMSDYGRQLEEHLAGKGWLKKAYVYWYDEPETNDYPFVVKGMERLRRYFPRLKRMLTEEFQSPLYGNVDLWCPITPNYRAEPAQERQAKGDEVWWYVCTGPKEPYCGLFIDHPAIEMRMWLWQTWKYRVQGILIWETTWWTSPSLFKETPQNPWVDPMSYTSEASGVWGNGDGRFFYPPVRKAGDTHEYVTSPIDSIRWELLGEGVQDWEYFHLLDGLVRRAEARGDHSAAVSRAKSLLTVPESICRDMTHYTTDPRLLDAYRDRVAKTIEGMERLTHGQAVIRKGGLPVMNSKRASASPAWRPPTLASASKSRPAGALVDRLERSLARLGKPPFTLPFIVADVSFSEKRIFTEYSGDISGRVLGVLARDAASGRKTQWPVGELLHKLSKYQKADGHFGAEQDLAHGLVGDRDMPILWGNGRLLIGLVEAYETGRDPLALAMARKLGDYYLTSDALLDRVELVDKFGNYAAGFATCYFSGLEGLAGLSRITKDRRYLDQAERMAKLMAETTEAKEQHSHGRLCALRGLLDLYEATGKRAYLDRVESEHAIWVKRFLWPTGGISEMSIPTFNRNEGCTEADWLRLNLQLWRLTGRDSYLDLADMTLKNDLAVDQFANGGFGHRVAAMTDGRMDGYYPAAHEGTQEAYWCCSEHGPRALMDVAPYEAAVLDRDVTLNLYEPAEMVLKIAGQPVRIIVAPTGLGEHVVVTVKTSRPIRFALRLRVPGWCSEFRFDGKTPARAADGRVVVERTWRDGDKIEIQMPFSVHYRLDGDPAVGRRTLGSDKTAMGSCVYYGPHLLVAPLTLDVKTLSATPTVSLREVEAQMRDGTGPKPAGSLPAESGFRCRVNLIP